MTTIDTEEFWINMGPQHPSTHGVLCLKLRLDGERVRECIPEVGYLHRSIEKMAEGRTFLQFIPVTDRVDYVTAMAPNYAFCYAVEKVAFIPVPRKGEVLRVIALELNRLASHCLVYGTLALEAGATTPFVWGFREREYAIDLMEELCGQRLTYNYFRVGGVSGDAPEGFFDRLLKFCDIMKKALEEYELILTNNVIWLQRTKNIGILPLDLAINYGVTGPNLRGSGMKWDIRRDEPFSIYPELEFDVPVGTVGDIWDRYKVRLEEMRQSVRILEQCAKKYPKKGPFRTLMRHHFTTEPGEGYARIESSRGELGCFLVLDGSKKPYRCKFRTASFSNLSVLPELLHDVFVADTVLIGGSLNIVLPEVDR